MALGKDGRAVLESSDDQSYCELILSLCSVGDGESESLATLFEPDVLQRLKDIRRRAAPVYYGSFLGPLRRQFRGIVLPQDLHDAMDHTEGGIEHIGGDVPPETFEAEARAYFHTGSHAGASPGWSNVAQHYTVRPGEMTIITGIGSHLKSTWLQALCINLAHNHHWNFGVFSPEHAPLGELARLLVEGHHDTFLRDMPDEMFDEALPWLSQHFHPMAALEDFPPNLSWILSVARQQVMKYGIRGLVIDPWNEVDHQFGRQAETHYISESLSRLRRFARLHQVHVWVVVHPTKMQKAQGGVYAGKYPPPTPYDCAGSAHWMNKGDNCLCIWRDVEEDEKRGQADIEVHIQKVRYRAVGKTGLVHLTYTGRQFLEPEVAEDLAWLR